MPRFLWHLVVAVCLLLLVFCVSHLVALRGPSYLTIQADLQAKGEKWIYQDDDIQ